MLMSAEETQTDRHADRCIRRTVYIRKQKSDATTFGSREEATQEHKN